MQAMLIKNLNVKAEKLTVPVANANANLQHIESYKISGADRDVQKTHTVDIEQNDKLLEFVFDDGTVWMCDAATLHELFPEAHALKRDGDTTFELPAAISNSDSDRGFFGGMALSILNVFKKKAIPGGIGTIVEKLEKKLMEKGEGLLKLGRDFNLSPFDKKESEKPYLIFMHGTNSNTEGAFGSLRDADVWEYIHNTYVNNVLAFQHKTLSKSPLQNVVELVAALPDSAEVHIISHSRGGLVGDVLCRYSLNSNNTTVGFVDDHINLLKKEGRQNDVDCILSLNKTFKAKKIKVTKFIRVACPAAGTKLASNRIDTILNTFFNLFGGSLNPVADVLKELIAETIRTKDDTTVLPGLEAQSPDSPFIKILNDRSADVAIDGKSLVVISGNGKLSLSLKGLLVILGKLFYTQRNDLVVNTDSMYLGANRKEKIQYFFDQGADVDHVKYFLNNRTRQAIYIALKAKYGEMIPGFTYVEQYDVPASDRALFGIEHGELLPYPNVPTGSKPIVVLLPGIMGSNLSTKDNKIWLAYLRSVFGGLTDLQYIDDKSITADSLIKTSYKQLADRLSKTYDVVIYPFDWRKQLNECAREFNEKIIDLLKKNMPIKIIGHSMGGLLVRDFIINYDDTWQKLNSSKGFRLLFLGSPLGGSFRIPTVLFGNDAIINSLNMLDRKHTKKELIAMFATFPGILSLLPLTTDAANDFADENTWKKMAEAMGDVNWPIPSASDLLVFKKYRDNILAKRDAIDYSKMIYIAGKDKFTPCGYYNDTIPPRTELVFEYTAEGDQSVTWELGIPKQMINADINKSTVYYVNVSHGALANEPDIFNGIEQLLEKGTTNILNKNRPAVRGEEQVFRMPELYNFDFSERGIHNAIFGVSDKAEPTVNQIPMSISVSNGDLSYASYPLLAGHFNNDGILYAEKAIDRNVNGSLHDRHYLGLYPGAIGTNTIVATDMPEQSFRGAIIAGLGEPGKLTSYLLTKTVEQAVSKYLLNMNSKPGDKQEIGISALIIGCGYGGLTIENSLKSIIEGTNNANRKVIECRQKDIRTVQHIEFIEVYEDKALSCLYALSKIENKENRIYNITLANKKIKELFGLKKRFPLVSSDEWWNRLTIKMKRVEENTIVNKSLVFNASTSDARDEEKELFSSLSLVDLFIKEISTNNRWTTITAKTLFELMIPNEFKENLKKKGNICWVLDKDTAEYPWELLKENVNETKPLCIGAGMIRQLSTTDYSQNINRVATEMALVVADPALDGFINQLKGAEAEGLLVKDLFTSNGYQNVSLINKSASEIVLNLFSNDYKIIHLAGHGIYNPMAKQKSGMVIGKDMFLTTADIKQMSTVPELVFVNCCHLGNTDGDNERFFRDRYKLAANIGTELIEMGVKAVIAAGWAVDDAAATDFANVFYTKIFDGYNFGDAVTAARSSIYEKYHLKNNTWGAYQCYGDPFYKLINRSVSTTNYVLKYIIDEEVEIDLNNLRNDLDTKNINSQKTLERLKLINDAMLEAKIGGCKILEEQALIYYELGEYYLAIQKFEELKLEEYAGFSVATLEKYCNAKGKLCVKNFRDAKTKTSRGKEMEKIIGELTELLNINVTSERTTLMASAYKRKGMVTIEPKAKLAAYKNAASNYKKAFEIKDGAYAFNKWIIFQTAVNMTDKTAPENIFEGEKTTTDMIKLVEARKLKLCSNFNNMDYWQLIEDVCYDFSLVMLDEKRAKKDEVWKKMEEKYRRIWASSGSTGKKMAEIENFEILADALNLSTTKRAVYLKERVNDLKGSLEKILLDD